MNLLTLLTILCVALILAELSIAHADQPAPEPRGPAVNFKVIGQDQSDNSYIFVTDRAGTPRLASITSTISWVRVHNAPEGMRIYALWNAGKFGQVMIEADNSGKGFSASETDYYLLNYELAATRARRLQEALRDMEQNGYTIDNSLSQQITAALSSFDKAQQGDDENENARLSDITLERVLFAHEELTMERARQDIEKNRKASATLTIVGPDSNPIADADIEIKQVSRDFLIGHNAMGQHEKYRDKFLGIVNFATIPFYLKGLAPEKDKYDWASREVNAKWQIEHGIDTKGHPLTWFFDATTPDYTKDLSWKETVEFYKENAKKNVAHFKGLIDKWDVINEAHGWANGGWTQDQMNELTDVVSRAAREANPDATIVVNSCLPLGQYVQWKPDQEIASPYEYYEALNKQGVPYDIIGLQMYNGIASPFPTCDITLMSEIIDRYSRLGKPIHITEFSVPSVGDEWGSWHDNKWTEETQAEYVRRFYTMAFSKEEIGAITWWCFWDGANWVPNSGVLREDMSEKPAYQVLKELVESWTTQTNGKTGDDGIFSFRGFHGSYQATVRANGVEKTVNFNVGKKDTQVTVQL